MTQWNNLKRATKTTGLFDEVEQFSKDCLERRQSEVVGD